MIHISMLEVALHLAILHAIYGWSLERREAIYARTSPVWFDLFLTLFSSSAAPPDAR